MTDYSVYLGTVAAAARVHGIFVVTPDPNPKDDVHTTKKMPETQGQPEKGEGGVKSFAMTADEAVTSTTDTRMLGRRFGEGNIIGVDCDGWIPPEDWTNGTGYREISASGMGAHIICRIAGDIPPATNKLKFSAEKAAVYGFGGEVELFTGRGNGIALSGRDATAGDIDLDASSDAAKCIYALLESLRTAAPQTVRRGKEGIPATAETQERAVVEIPNELFEFVPYLPSTPAEEEYKKMFFSVMTEARSITPESVNYKDDASAAFQSAADRIALMIADYEIDTGEHWLTGEDSGAGKAMLQMIWEATEVYKQCYGGDTERYHDAKIDATLEKAIQLAKGKVQGYEPHERTLYQVACEIAQKRRFVYVDDKGDECCNQEAYCREWQRYTHAAALKGTRDNFVWFTGVEWAVDDYGTEMKAALLQCANETGTTKKVKDALKHISPRDIASYRRGAAAVPIGDAYAHGLTCQDGVIIINEDGIIITHHNPTREVWFGGVPLETTDLIDGVERMPLREVLLRFPHFVASLRECGQEGNIDEKVRLVASMAGVAIYYTMPNHIPLDAWFYLWDAGDGGTGKSTHLRMFTKFFAKYVANTGWQTFSGAKDENAEWLGKVGVVCEETGVNRIKDVEKIKNRTSGRWGLKRLYVDEINIPQPLLLISLANTKPLFEKVADSRPIWERLQPCEFTQKLRNSGKAFPCSEEEYNRALLNVGCCVAYKLMQKGSSVSKQDLPFYVSPEENEKLTEFVRWKDVLMEIGTVCESNEESLGRVLVRLKGALAERGCDITGAPELRTQESFKRAVDGLRYTMNGKQVTISAKGRPNSRRIDGCKFVITNYKLNELPHGTGKRTVEGYYYLAPCGTVDAVECETEDTTGWDITSWRGEPDPYPEREYVYDAGKLTQKKKCTLCISGGVVDGIR